MPLVENARIAMVTDRNQKFKKKNTLYVCAAPSWAFVRRRSFFAHRVKANAFIQMCIVIVQNNVMLSAAQPLVINSFGKLRQRRRASTTTTTTTTTKTTIAAETRSGRDGLSRGGRGPSIADETYSSLARALCPPVPSAFHSRRPTRGRHILPTLLDLQPPHTHFLKIRYRYWISQWVSKRRAVDVFVRSACTSRTWLDDLGKESCWASFGDTISIPPPPRTLVMCRFPGI